jgi:hypothetical protein
MGFILTLVAFLLLIILALPAIIIGSVIAFNKINEYWMSIALATDHFGNVICQHLFNITIIKLGGYKFGNIKETISSVLGKNYVESVRRVGLHYSYTKEKIVFPKSPSIKLFFKNFRINFTHFLGSIYNRTIWLKILRNYGTLTRTGIFLCLFLNELQKNHVQDSIDNNV